MTLGKLLILSGRREALIVPQELLVSSRAWQMAGAPETVLLLFTVHFKLRSFSLH